MIRYIVYVCLGAGAIFLQTTFLALWPSELLRFELLWLLVLFLAFATPFSQSAAIVISLGFMADLSGSPFVGFFAIVYFLFTAFLRVFMAHMFVETMWARLLWVGLLTLAVLCVEWGMLKLMGQGSGLRAYIMAYGILQSLVTMATSIVVMPLLDRVEGTIAKQYRGL